MAAVRIAMFCLLALLLMPAGAQAAFPGQNGDIAVTFDQECDGETVSVLTFDPDTGLETDHDIAPAGRDPAWSASGNQVAFDVLQNIYVQTLGSSSQPMANGTSPSWSPDGRLAYLNGGGIATINADGSGFQQVLTADFTEVVRTPRWSPDGTRIAFSARFDGEADNELYVLKLADSSVTKLTDNAVSDTAPSWAPTGDELVFLRNFSTIHRMAANGGVASAALATGADGPAWSPDGTRIVFSVGFGGGLGSGIVSMSPDGSDQQAEFSIPGYCVETPDWQPLPVNTPSTYARPKAATPILAPLVPAYATCTSPNRVHGGSLNYGSCAPPDHLSPTLTVGVGDGSLAFSRSVGSVRLAALPGVPGGIDDADMALRLSITNVMRKSDLSDYPGELGVDLSLQMTDKEGAVGQTAMGFGLSATAPCTATDSTIDGATCALDTTVEALIPAAITEGARAVFELGPIRVRDGGTDEDADTPAGDGVLATQGVFVP
jgi:Tol biopolymer transport system component